LTSRRAMRARMVAVFAHAASSLMRCGQIEKFTTGS
jgi:hypothetical protein